VTVLYEPCSGAAAVSLATFGALPPVSYRGGKRRYATEILQALGVMTCPDRIVLNDVGCWGWAWKTWAVVGTVPLQAWLNARTLEGRALWDELVASPASEDPVVRLATFLALQDASVNGKPVQIIDGCWRTAGYAELSPLARSKGFRERLLPKPLAKRLGRVTPNILSAMSAYRADAATLSPAADVIYIDPDYAGAGYPNSMPHKAVLALARSYAADGATVGISGRTAVEELVHEGWVARRLSGNRKVGAFKHNRSATRSTNEWLTYMRGKEEEEGHQNAGRKQHD